LTANQLNGYLTQTCVKTVLNYFITFLREGKVGCIIGSCYNIIKLSDTGI